MAAQAFQPLPLFNPSRPRKKTKQFFDLLQAHLFSDYAPFHPPGGEPRVRLCENYLTKKIRLPENCYKIICHFVYLAIVVRRSANNQGF